MMGHFSPWTGLKCVREDPHDESAPTGHIAVASEYAQQGMEEKQND